MARKARTAPSNEPALPIEAAQPTLAEPAPAPRRGRRPKAVAPVAEPTLPGDDGGAGAGNAAPASPLADSVPARRRPGRKPRGLEEAAASSLVEQALEQQPEADAEALTSSTDDAMIAEMAYPVSAGEGSAGEGSDTPASDAVPPQGQDAVVPDASASAPAKPAAQWDRATDMVQFDWPAIERTAAQDGPNQAMAKLLVAARAEGANARWPF